MKNLIHSNRLRGDVILLIVAIIWGSGFIAQRIGAPYLGFFYFNAFRFLVGAIVMLILLKFTLKFSSMEKKVGMMAGFLLFAGATLQQAGIEQTTAGKAGFITGLYMVIIPIMLTIFWKERFPKITWAAVVIALAGMGLLSLQGDLSLAPGDGLIFVSSFIWAFHVILIGKNIHKVNVLKTALIQYAVCAIASFGGGILSESVTIENLGLALPALLYTGIISIGIAYTLQLVGQRYAPPVDSAIILSMESVFSMFFGITLLNESINFQQFTGCILMFSAMLLTQIPSFTKNKIQEKVL